VQFLGGNVRIHQSETQAALNDGRAGFPLTIGLGLRYLGETGVLWSES
jgi:hypothetical protein